MKKTTLWVALLMLAGATGLISCAPEPVTSSSESEALRGIVSITKTGTEGNVDTYTITYTDGTTSTFTVTNGKDGEQGSKGDPGNDAPHYGETHVVTYHLNGGSMPDGVETTATVGWGDTVDLPTPVYYGHVFEGWFTGEGTNLFRQFYSTDAVFSDLDLYAGWSEGTYTVTLDLDGGTYAGETALSFKYGSSYELPTVGISKAAYKFTGWTLEGEEVTSSGTYLYENITLKAAYEATIDHTIYLNLNGGEYAGETEIAVKTSSGYVLPSEGITNGTRIFAGWYNGEEKWDFTGTYELDTDIYLAAKWEDLYTYPLSVDLNGGTLESAPTEITNAEIFDGRGLSVPSKEGYTFLGYYDGRMKLTDESGLVTNRDLLSISSSNSIVARYVAADGSFGGDYAYLGEYPQAEVTDTATVSHLFTATDTDGDGYVEYGGKEYAKVAGSGVNGYASASTYYFEVEPILWEVGADGELVSSLIIDARAFYEDSRSNPERTYLGALVYSNNYEYSDIRAFLNGYDGSPYEIEDYGGKGFIDLAFASEEKALILEAEVDNTAATTSDTEINPYVSTNTADKIYLLSYQDAANDYASSDARMREATDYSRCVGLADYNATNLSGSFWTRSPTPSNSDRAARVRSGGSIDASNRGVYFLDGLVPAFKLVA